MSDLPVVVGVGGQTSIGLTFDATAAAVRAGLNAFSLSSFRLGRESGEAFKIGALGTLAPDLSPYQRMASMARAAAEEALRPWRAAGNLPESEPVVVLLAVPENRSGFSEDSGPPLLLDIVADLPMAIQKRYTGLVSTGHEGGLGCLTYAAGLIRSGEASACLVGGVDSYLDIDTLHRLEAEGRALLAQRPNGFVPAEGAGFLLVCSAALARHEGLTPLCELVAGGRGIESNPWQSGRATLGEGLTQAFQEALAAHDPANGRIRVTYSDLNGESWRADEWAYAYVRTGPHHGSPLDLRVPASNWGDVGAASGPLLVGLAALDLGRFFQPGDHALVWAASDGPPYRSACLLRSPA